MHSLKLSREWVLTLWILTISLLFCNAQTDQATAQPVPHLHEENHQAQAQLLFDKNHIQNQDHIMEHLEGVMNKPEKEMTEEELQFHYFKLHDYDSNNKLDGIEIIDAMTHYHKGEKPSEQKEDRMPDTELMSIVDDIMKEEDLNQDGYIDYMEFMTAQRAQDEEKQQL